MGIFNQRIPVEDIDLTYQISFKGGASKILELMQRQGFISGDADTVRIDLNDSERFTNIIAEYALFLKAVVIHVVRKNTSNFSDKDRKKVDEAFPVVDQLLESLLNIPEYRTALLGRVDDYLHAIDNDQVCGYCAQNAIGFHNYKFVENISRSDFPKCSFLFADFVYYIAQKKTFATLEDVQRVKEIASNDDRATAKSFMAYANAVVVDAECLAKQIHNDLNVAYNPEAYKKSFVASTPASNDTQIPSSETEHPSNTPGSTLCVPEDDYVASEIIPHINGKIIDLLLSGYADLIQKLQGTDRIGYTKLLNSYENMKDFEAHVVSLANHYTLDKKKTYLKMMDECYHHPIAFSEGLVAMLFANKLTKGTATIQDAQAFEDHLRSVHEKWDPSIHYDFRGGDYMCPRGKVTQEDIDRFERELYSEIASASSRKGVSKWFRQYYQLADTALNYAKSIFRVSNGTIVSTIFPGVPRNLDETYSLLFAQAFHAGITAAEIYCSNKGDVRGIGYTLERKGIELMNTAQQSPVFRSHGNDPFAQKFAPILRAAVNQLAITKPNAELHMKCLVVSLKAVFQFGAGLYFEPPCETSKAQPTKKQTMASDMLARANAVDPIKMKIDKAQSEECSEKKHKAEVEEKARKQLSDAAQELTRIEKEIDGVRHQLSQINEDIAQLKFAFWGERKRHKQELEQIRTQLNNRLTTLYKRRSQL